MRMKEFYYIRHGQTDANLEKLMCGGEWDLPLNETGIEQATRAADILASRAPAFSTVCVSSMLRARQTAAIVAPSFRDKFTIMKSLREWSMGAWDRQPMADVLHLFSGDADPAEGETRADFHRRVHDALLECLKLPAPLLIVAHGAVWLAVQKNLGLAPVRVDNCIPHRVYQDDLGVWQIERL